MEQPVIQPTHSAHQECSTVDIAPCNTSQFIGYLLQDSSHSAHIDPYLLLGMKIVLFCECSIVQPHQNKYYTLVKA